MPHSNNNTKTKRQRSPKKLGKKQTSDARSNRTAQGSKSLPKQQRKKIEDKVLLCVRSPNTSWKSLSLPSSDAVAATQAAATRLYGSIDTGLFMKVYRGHLNNISNYWDKPTTRRQNTTVSSSTSAAKTTTTTISSGSCCHHLPNNQLFPKDVPLQIQMTLARCLATYEVKTHERKKTIGRDEEEVDRDVRSPTTPTTTEKIHQFNSIMVDSFIAGGEIPNNLCTTDKENNESTDGENSDIKIYRDLCLALAANARLQNFHDFTHLMVLFVLFFDTWDESLSNYYEVHDSLHDDNEEVDDPHRSSLTSPPSKSSSPSMSRRIADLELLRKKSRYLTERGIVSFLNKRLPCSCLSALNKQVKQVLPDQRLCFACQIPVRRDAILECSVCRTALYCSDACQSKNWAQHKADCKYFAKYRNTNNDQQCIMISANDQDEDTKVDRNQSQDTSLINTEVDLDA